VGIIGRIRQWAAWIITMRNCIFAKTKFLNRVDRSRQAGLDGFAIGIIRRFPARSVREPGSKANSTFTSARARSPKLDLISIEQLAHDVRHQGQQHAEMTWMDDQINDDHQRRQAQNPFAHGHPLALRMPLMMRATIQQ